MAAPTLILVSFFLIWLIIAIIAPWKFAPSRIKGLPVLRFGYSNNRSAYHLEYRLKDHHDQEVSEWKSVPLLHRSTVSSGVNCFPEKRERKYLRNSERVIKLLRQYGYRKTAHHDPYWYLMNYLQQGDDAATAQALQLRIVARKKYRQQGNDGLIFISDWHIQ